ncbi:MAG: UDP-N-acetylmuramoyl-L-alanine--D-glutamate ligase [Candidatus Paceibacterota bacterium]
MKISALGKEQILILGAGREGLDTFLFLRKQFKNKKLFIADQKEIRELDLKTRQILKKDKNNEYFGGKNYLDNAKDYSVVIKSPGIQMKKIRPFFSKTAKFTSQTELFFDNCPGTIIGITGTKGKSTTSALIHNILIKNKISAHLVGNIETPALSFLSKAKKKDYFVFELSCHQLQFLRASPHIAVFLNLFPEHLDYYKDFKEYFAAKSNIAIHQKTNDYFIFNPKIKELKNLAKKVRSKIIPIDPKKYKSVSAAIPGLKAITHMDNLAAVMEVGKILKLSNEQILKGIRSFKGLPHRLERVGKYRGIEFYDDSISTIPEAAVFALDTLGDRVNTMILGGMDRGIDFKKISERLVKSNIKNLILFPTSGKKILNGIEKKELKRFDVFFADDMSTAIKIAFAKTEPGKICLLSPASPSFGLFRDYKERGDLFKKYIKQYGASKSKK